MRASVLALCLCMSPAWAQQTAVASATAQQQLTSALLGQWTGVLEYRDYSEPATSTKRVQLPTWLTIRQAPEGVVLDYIYDDGPNKTVFSHNALDVDLAKFLYRVVGTDSGIEQYSISGADTLKDGHGILTLLGKGKDAGKPAEVRMTWTVRRNLLSWLEEVRPEGSSEPFVFRHRYTFTRAQAPPSGAAPAASR
jgi:hypothetical protein